MNISNKSEFNMKLIEPPPQCPKCSRRNLIAMLAHRPPPANPSWAIHIHCLSCRWFIIIDCAEVNNNQVEAFKSETNQKNLKIVKEARKHDSN